MPTPWQFAGEVLFIKPHGAGRQWRWILHSPSIHVDVGLGKLTHIVAKARLSSAFLWEHEIGTALTLLYGFLADLLQVPFTFQVSEVHLCVDMAGWELSLDDMSAFITRSRSKGLRLGSEAADEELDASLEATGPFTAPSEVRVQFAGRRLATLDFSKGAPHACCIYDKTAEIAVSRKDWMQEVWTSNGWDGEVARHAGGVPLQARVPARDEGRRGIRLSRSDPRTVGVLHQAVATAHHPQRGSQPRAVAPFTALAARPAGQLLLRWHTSCPRAAQSG